MFVVKVAKRNNQMYCNILVSQRSSYRHRSGCSKQKQNIINPSCEELLHAYSACFHCTLTSSIMSLLFLIATTFTLALNIQLSYCNSEYLVGINYFAGWWPEYPNKWHEPWNESKLWTPLYPQRIPLIGNFTTNQSTMDNEIIAASQHGIDFFQILYYDNYPTEREPNSIYLNSGLKNFVSSKESYRMSFFIEWCNTYPLYGFNNESEFIEMIDKDWLPAFNHSSYLRIDNKLVFKIINAGQLYQNCNESSKCVTNLLDNILRSKVRDAGLGEMIIGGGLGAKQTTANSDVLSGYTGYNWTGTYMDGPWTDSNSNYTYPNVYPWDAISSWTVNARNMHENDEILYLPYVAVGWDPRPWNETRPSFVFPNVTQFKNDLMQVMNDLDGNNKLGFPIGNNGDRQKAFHIYAWNEFGEGGIMAPTQGWQYQRLETVQSVFATG